MTMTAARNRAATPAAAPLRSRRLQASLPLPLPLPLPLSMLLAVMLLLLLVLVPPQPCESRYLPTRSHGDELDKLRELMLQILELSNEDPQQLQQQQQQQQQLAHQMRLHNEANYPLTAQRGSNGGGSSSSSSSNSNSNSNSNAAWLQKLGALGALDTEAGYGRY